ncbi:hypothetical protein F5146DRAFT_1000147 [Armillaria mellea]|nr:hypothetical protein F5146DRAFT_1192452 [Armillaria mellea]KAK0193054.1 hypothetical protein F5146DRAFT_1000147 [Armillaria mellea]
MASVNPGILSYTIALVIVIGMSLTTILSPFKPALMVKTLNKTVEKTYIHYDEHKDMLDELAGFKDKVNRLWVEAFKLQERCLQACDDMAWTDLCSWRRYMQETKAIWVKACQHQRETIKLRKALKLAIIRAHRVKLEAAIGHHSQEKEEMTKGEVLEGSLVI